MGLGLGRGVRDLVNGRLGGVLLPGQASLQFIELLSLLGRRLLARATVDRVMQRLHLFHGRHDGRDRLVGGGDSGIRRRIDVDVMPASVGRRENERTVFALVRGDNVKLGAGFAGGRGVASAVGARDGVALAFGVDDVPLVGELVGGDQRARHGRCRDVGAARDKFRFIVVQLQPTAFAVDQYRIGHDHLMLAVAVLVARLGIDAAARVSRGQGVGGAVRPLNALAVAVPSVADGAHAVGVADGDTQRLADHAVLFARVGDRAVLVVAPLIVLVNRVNGGAADQNARRRQIRPQGPSHDGRGGRAHGGARRLLIAVIARHAAQIVGVERRGARLADLRRQHRIQIHVRRRHDQLAVAVGRRNRQGGGGGVQNQGGRQILVDKLPKAVDRHLGVELGIDQDQVVALTDDAQIRRGLSRQSVHDVVAAARLGVDPHNRVLGQFDSFRDYNRILIRVHEITPSGNGSRSCFTNGQRSPS